MSKRQRPADFDLRKAIRTKEFTPSVSDVPALVALVGGPDDDASEDATKALLRIPHAIAKGVGDALPSAEPEAKAKLARLLGRLPAEEAKAPLLGLLAAPESRVRRAAVTALGKLGGEGVEDALLAIFPGADPAETRALATALGKAGGARAAEALATLEPGEDTELARIVERARLMRARDAARESGTHLDREAIPGEPLPLELRCRAGLEPLLLDELREVDAIREPTIAGQGRVTATLVGAPSGLDRARLFYELRFPLPSVRTPEDEVEAVVGSLTSPRARTLLALFTRGEPRVRIDWEDARARRATTWKIASELAANGIVNDPRDAPWQARVHVGRDGKPRVALVPRGFEDPRFAWRRADVPASSHPTIAAAIARVAGVRPDDVVWDPFVGAGAELVERARLGPYRRLYGTDLDTRALEASRANLEAAGFEATLVLEDATLFQPDEKPTLILSNPPMGRRVHRGDVSPLLERFLAHAALVSSRDARLVWIDPLPRTMRGVAERHGFELVRALDVDMGGFVARLEHRVKRGR